MMDETPDWIVSSIKPCENRGFYRWHVAGVNLSDGGRTFSWTVEDVDDPRYAFTPEAQEQLYAIIKPAPRCALDFWHQELPETQAVKLHPHAQPDIWARVSDADGAFRHIGNPGIDRQVGRVLPITPCKEETDGHAI